MAIPKIRGIETEWSIILPDRKKDIVANAREFNIFLRVIRQFFNLPYTKGRLAWETCDSEAERRLIEQMKKERETMESGGFLPNGSRIYIDYPHLEYSTPECLTGKDLIAADKAGNRILWMAAKRVSKILGERVVVLKDNSDRKGHSFASHENYLLDRKTFDKLIVNFEGIQDKIVSFLVSRQILSGSGKIGIERGRRRQRKKSIYQISQRADFITEISGFQTTSDRNIINTRDEPHADKKRFARLHLILGDANFCEWSLYLRTGTTAIVLKMLEDGFIQNAPVIAKPVKAIKEISQDASCKKLIQLTDKRRMRAVDIQIWYLDLSRRYFAKIQPTEEEKDILEKWAFVLEKLQHDPMSLVGYLDWPTKAYLIAGTQKKLNINFENPKLRIVDVLYHDINPSQGLYYRLLENNKIKRIIADEQIERFIQAPPENTRAYLRGLIVKHWPKTVIDWEEILRQKQTESIAQNKDLTVEEHFVILLKNPLITREEADVLFNKIRALVSESGH